MSTRKTFLYLNVSMSPSLWGLNVLAVIQHSSSGTKGKFSTYFTLVQSLTELMKLTLKLCFRNCISEFVASLQQLQFCIVVHHKLFASADIKVFAPCDQMLYRYSSSEIFCRWNILFLTQIIHWNRACECTVVLTFILLLLCLLWRSISKC